MEFEKIITKEISTLNKLMRDMPFSDISFYEVFLSQTYYFTKHSTKLLICAKDYLKNDLIKQHFIEHAKEEAGHHILAKNDLKNLNKKNVTDFEEFEETKTLYKRIYDSTPNEPFAVLGYAMALEFLAVEASPWILKKLPSTPEISDSFLKEHGELDIEHTKEALGLYNSLDDFEKQHVEKYFLQTIIDYSKFINKIDSEYLSTKKVA